MALNNSLFSPFQNLSKIVYTSNTIDFFQQKEAYVKLSIVCIQDLSYAVFSHEQPVNPLILEKQDIYACMIVYMHEQQRNRNNK